MPKIYNEIFLIMFRYVVDELNYLLKSPVKRNIILEIQNYILN